jgi:hypothetical protein
MERGVWGERLKKSFHFKYKIVECEILLEDIYLKTNL